MENKFSISFSALSENEAFARMCISAFLLPRDPTVNEMSDIKTAVSEAVTNAIIHGYNGKEGMVDMRARLDEDTVYIEISDTGVGIDDIAAARKPLFTTRPDCERSGMGFTVMEAFMDEVDVVSEKGRGTKISMTRKLRG
ncbi:MAG: anti-sigma F factor [Firmicutes bacterium]|nr:anti-sigma F factor [Bacillota bacterium]